MCRCVSRWPGEPLGGWSARAPNSFLPTMRAKKNLRGGPPGRLRGLEADPPGTMGPGGSTRTVPRRRRTPPRWQRVRRRAVLVRGSCQVSGNMDGKNEKTRGLAACRVSGSSGGRASGKGTALGIRRDGCTARRDRRGSAGRRVVVRDQEMRHRILLRATRGFQRRAVDISEGTETNIAIASGQPGALFAHRSERPSLLRACRRRRRHRTLAGRPRR